MPAPKRPAKPAARASAIRTLTLLVSVGVLVGVVVATILVIVASQSGKGGVKQSQGPEPTPMPQVDPQRDNQPGVRMTSQPEDDASDDEGYMPDYANMPSSGDEREPAWALSSPRGMIYLAAAGRSPIPNVGETFDKPLPFTRLEGGTPAEVSRSAPTDVLPWYEAEQHVGQTITIEGKVVNTNNTGSVCFLNFDPNWREHFYIIIFDEAFPLLPEKPELFYMDKTIRVTGEVYRRGGRAQMRIEKKNWDQITVVEKK